MREDTAQWAEEANAPDYRARLKAALKERKMSQAAFARYCGCSPSNISYILGPDFVGIVPKYIWEKARPLLK